jgi:type III secretory pathway component EscU
MADKSQRTEKATPKHRKESRDKGKVARSPELGAWAGLLVVAALLPRLGGQAADRIDRFLQLVAQSVAHPSTSAAIGVLAQGLGTAAVAALPIVLVCTAIGVASNFAQVGLRFTPKALGAQFSRISPRAGFSRIFSSQGAWSLGKTLVKVGLLAALGYTLLHQLMDSVLGGATLPLPTTLAAAGASIGGLLRDVGALALVVAGADYAFQRRSYQQGLRMTKQEVKDENRRNEQGPPAVPDADDGRRGHRRCRGDQSDPFRRRHRLRPEEGPGAEGGGQGRRPPGRPDPDPGRRARRAGGGAPGPRPDPARVVRGRRCRADRPVCGRGPPAGLRLLTLADGQAARERAPHGPVGAEPGGLTGPAPSALSPAG